MPCLQEFKVVWSHEQLTMVDQKCMPFLPVTPPGVNGFLFHFGPCWRGQESLLVWGSVVGALHNERPSCWNLCTSRIALFLSYACARCRPPTGPWLSRIVTFLFWFHMCSRNFQNLWASRQVGRPDHFSISHMHTITNYHALILCLLKYVWSRIMNTQYIYIYTHNHNITN